MFKTQSGPQKNKIIASYYCYLYTFALFLSSFSHRKQFNSKVHGKLAVLYCPLQASIYLPLLKDTEAIGFKSYVKIIHSFIMVRHGL